MSFSNNLLNYSKNLTSWVEIEQSLPSELETFRRYSLIIPGAVVEIYCQKEAIFYQLKNGSISQIEQGFLQALSSYIKIIHKVPNLREMDFFLRDQPSLAAWPAEFNINFLQEAVKFFELCFSLGDTPLEWLQHKLVTFDPSKYNITSQHPDLIILKGPKQDAWVVEKNFDEWQKQIREIFDRPKLVLLYAINS